MSRTSQSVFAFVVIAFIATFGFVGSVKADDRVFPFHPGEKLAFRIKWCFIPAGEVVFEVLPIETINGVKAYHFVMVARTYPFADFFYKVRDKIDSYTDIAMTRSILYKKDEHEGKFKKDVVVNFNWEKQEAQYSNFGKKEKPISILPGSFDPLAVFYAIRLNELKENTEIKVPVTDGKIAVMGRAKVVKREQIKVAKRIYDTYLVEPGVEHIGGVFEKKKKAKLRIWLTADNRRIPVKIKSKVVVGSFVAELMSAEVTGQDSSMLSPEEPEHQD